MIRALLRRLFGSNGPRVPAPPAVPPINQTPYDPGQVHPIKDQVRGYPRF